MLKVLILSTMLASSGMRKDKSLSVQSIFSLSVVLSTQFLCLLVITAKVSTQQDLSIEAVFSINWVTGLLLKHNKTTAKRG